jgi:hypothetical protein
VSGGELFTHLYQREKFKENEVRIYIAEIVVALQHLHKVSKTIFGTPNHGGIIHYCIRMGKRELVPAFLYYLASVAPPYTRLEGRGLGGPKSYDWTQNAGTLYTILPLPENLSYFI